MQRPTLKLTLKTRILLTISLWLLALLFSSCSTNIQFSNQPESTQYVIVPKPLKPSHKTSASQKKQQFFAYLKPIVISENNRILHLRQQLMHLKETTALDQHQLSWLQHIAADYNVSMATHPGYEQWRQLLDRVDIVPLEMALAQAANESAWGQSRFAQQGNNYFGQWCYQKGCGLVPKQRAAGAHHEVRRFTSPTQSVRAYLRNINRSTAYAEFRAIRHSLRVQRKPLDAQRLAVGLKSYSERGMAYVRTIQTMIRSNRQLILQSPTDS